MNPVGFSLADVTVSGALPPVSASVGGGEVGVVAVETEQGATILSLLAGGRMRADSGAVSPSAALLRESVALVDTPGICDPPGGVRLLGVVREELMIARRPSGRRAALAFLGSIGAEHHAGAQIRSLPSGVRLRALCELAALRPGVTGIVITSPERHGGSAQEWRGVAESLAARSFAVLVVTSRAGRTAHVSRPAAGLVAQAGARPARRYLPSTESTCQ